MHLCIAVFDWKVKLLIHGPHKRKEVLSARHITESWDQYPEVHVEDALQHRIVKAGIF